MRAAQESRASTHLRRSREAKKSRYAGASAGTSIMSRMRSRNTRPELIVRSLLHALGYRFRLHVSSLPGSPDVANKTKCIAIFVHGCFWHSHENCKLNRPPRGNQKYWAPKLARNVARDAVQIAALKKQSYRVLVVWECQTRNRESLARSLMEFMSGACGQLKL